MRFRAIRFQGLGPFREPVEIHLDDLRGPLVAVVGENGAGKSTALELLVGALYRSTPTRGSLRDLANRRDAFAEVVVNGGVTIRQMVDSVSGKGETMITRAGEVLVESGKMRDGDAWIAEHLPPADLVFATTFGVQGSGGFADLKPAERKAVLLRALGLEHLEELAEVARGRVRATRQRFETLAGASNEVEAAIDDGAGLDEELRACAEAMPALEAAVEAARLELDRAKVLGDIRALVLGREQDLESFRHSEAAALELLEGRDAILEAGEEGKAALDRARRLEREAKFEHAKASEAREDLAKVRAKWEAARTLVSNAEERRVIASDQAAKRANLEAFAAEHEGAEVEAGRIVTERLEWDSRLEERLASHAASTLLRVSKLRGGLVSVQSTLTTNDAGRSERAHLVAREALAGDAQIAELAESAPEEIGNMREKIADLGEPLPALHDAIRRLAVDAVTLEHLDTSEDVERFDIMRQGHAADVSEHFAEGERVRTIAAEHRDRGSKLEADAEELRRRAAHLEPIASKRSGLDRAEGRIEELRTKIKGGEAALEHARVSLEAAHGAPDVPDAQTAVGIAEADLGAARRDEGRLEARSVALKRAKARQVEIEAERAPLEADLADWNLLARTLGRDGVQAALIDAAGPELTDLVNDLLHTCVGPRWSVEVRTTRAKASGRGELEALDLIVVDTVEGREGEISTYSGGERVILGEAVALALATLAARRAGIEPGSTIVRDESGAALDEGRAEQWIAMVRRAAEHVGASLVLVVTHDRRAAALCDSALLVEGRTIRPVTL